MKTRLRLGAILHFIISIGHFACLFFLEEVFNANELRRADHKVHDIADGRYDGRIQKYQQGLTR